MDRWWSAAAAAVLAGAALLVVAAPASSSGVSIRVTPSQGLVDGQTVTVSGRGLPRADQGAAETWFVTQCTDAVRGHLDAARDTSHCDVAAAKAVHVSPRGTFSTRFQVIAGIVGDGYCGSDGHNVCVIGVGTAQGEGTVARIEFQGPPATTTTTTG